MYVNNISERSSSRVLQRPGQTKHSKQRITLTRRTFSPSHSLLASVYVCWVAGGNQSINLFGGSDEPVEQPQRRTGRRQQQDITPSIGSQPVAVEQPKPSFTSHTSSIGSVFNDAAPASASGNSAQQTIAQVNAPFGQGSKEVAAAGVPPAAAAPRVNNIWGNDDDQPQRSSTRVLRGPGGGSSGVAGALGGAAGSTQPEAEQRRPAGGYRANQTSANSPFSSEPEPQRSSTRVQQQPGGGGNGNILSCKPLTAHTAQHNTSQHTA